MISFHKSHSRRDLIEIVKIFKLRIEDAEDLNKKDLTDKMIEVISVLDKIIPDNHYLGINDIHELKEYLIKPNQKKMLSIKDKNEIITTAKLIIQYCKGGYVVEISYFDTMDEIYSEARRVAQFGDIPSVRRMCNLLNKNPYSKEIIIPIISQKVQKDLEIKKLTSKKVHQSLHVKTGGGFMVRFD